MTVSGGWSRHHGADVTSPQIAEAAYVYGFPLVVMNGTEAQLTNVSSAQQFLAPINQFNTPSTPVTPPQPLRGDHHMAHSAALGMRAAG